MNLAQTPQQAIKDQEASHGMTTVLQFFTTTHKHDCVFKVHHIFSAYN